MPAAGLQRVIETGKKKPRRSGVCMAGFFILITQRNVAFYADSTLFYGQRIRFYVDRRFADSRPGA
jgi:hypothetical protein